MERSSRCAAIVLMCGLIGFSADAVAQMRGGAPPRNRLGADMALVFPSGAWSEKSGLGIGPVMRYERQLNRYLGLSIRGGFVSHFRVDVIETDWTRAKRRTWEAPLLVGPKYYFSTSFLRFYLGADFGLTAIDTQTIGERGGLVDVESDTEFALAASLGGGLELLGLDLRVQLLLPDVNDLVGMMFNIGYSVPM